MSTELLVVTGPGPDGHTHIPGHPERLERLPAALDGIRRADLIDAVTMIESRWATDEELTRAHDPAHIEAMRNFCERGGGQIDADTYAKPTSWSTAMLAAGSGLVAIDTLRAGQADTAFCAFRPPGHHAERAMAMGFCLVNNIAVAACSLVAAGERVMIVDWDVHHGNGTQDIFYHNPNVLYVSTHQASTYPGTGRVRETGGPDAPFSNLNLPLPDRSTGDVLLALLDEVIIPVGERFRPQWLLISAGFDAHRADPLADLSWTAADYTLASARLATLIPKGRTVLMLEGGYDLDALSDCVGATLSWHAGGSFRPEAPSSGGPGREVVDAARKLWGL